jgi:hypothetical protein
VGLYQNSCCIQTIIYNVTVFFQMTRQLYIDQRFTWRGSSLHWIWGSAGKSKEIANIGVFADVSSCVETKVTSLPNRKNCNVVGLLLTKLVI